MKFAKLFVVCLDVGEILCGSLTTDTINFLLEPLKVEATFGELFAVTDLKFYCFFFIAEKLRSA